MGARGNVQRGRLKIRRAIVRGDLLSDVIDEPIARQLCDSVERARFFKEMRRAGNDLQLYFAAHPIARLLV
jgi:hypothetical protein